MQSNRVVAYAEYQLAEWSVDLNQWPQEDWSRADTNFNLVSIRPESQLHTWLLLHGEPFYSFTTPEIL